VTKFETEQDTELNDMQQAVKDFQETRFYQWCDSLLVGRFHWLILPITGFVDAFVIVLPTEAVLGMYLLRDKARSVIMHTLWVATFATLGYLTLTLLATMLGASFAEGFVSWVGEDISTQVDGILTSYVFVLAILSGITSIFPMPATAFAIVVGLTGAPIVPFAAGIFIGKAVRFGGVGYLTQRYGIQTFEYYTKHANTMTVVILSILAVYFGIKYFF